MDTIKYFWACLEGAYTIDKTFDTTGLASFTCNLEAVWIRSNTFCACLEGAYTIDKTIGTTGLASFTYVEAAWIRSNIFCACLEGAYTIDKTIDTLHDRACQFSA